MELDAAYTIADLARLSGLNVRTIRYYLAQGLIPGSGESGPGAHYGQGHLDRLRLTKRLQAQHLPLAEIRNRLEQLSDDQVAELLAESGVEPAQPQSSALDYIRSILGPKEGPAASFAEAAPPYSPMGITARKAFPAPVARSMPAPSTPAAPGAMPRMRDVPAPAPTPQPGPPPSVGRITELTSTKPAAPAPSETAPSPERSLWERLALGPNIELHVRRPLSRVEQKRVDRLITIARQVLRDDQA